MVVDIVAVQLYSILQDPADKVQEYLNSATNTF